MGRAQRTLERLLRGRSDANVEFADLTALLQALGARNVFEEVTTSSYDQASTKLLNLQRDGSQAKVYQVRQVRAVIL